MFPNAERGMMKKELTEGCQNYVEQVLMDRGGLQKAENENYGFTGNTGCWYMLENCPGSMVGRQVAGNAGCGDSGYPWAAQAGDD